MRNLGLLGVSAFLVCYLLIIPNSAFAQYSIIDVGGDGTPGFAYDGGPAVDAELNYPFGVAVDGSGEFFIADAGNNRTRKVSTVAIITTFAGNGAGGYAGDGGDATASPLYYPSGVAIDGTGNVYIADIGNNRVRRVAASGIISTVAGNSFSGYAGDGGAATAASLNQPAGIAVDGSGNLYIADLGNNRVRMVSASGIISTLAGIGSPAYAGDGGAASAASLSSPSGVAVDGTGNVFIADNANNVIRRVSPTGTISTVAGNGSIGYSGDGGIATLACLYSPYGVAIDRSGNLFIADTYNNCIRKVTSSGIIGTIAGTGVAGYSGDGGAASAAKLNFPSGVTVDGSGNVYVADTHNNRVRKLIPEPASLPKTSNNAGRAVSVYPNPASELFYLTVPDIISYADITVLNSLGIVVRHLRTDNKFTQIDISNLNNGRYVIQITTGCKQFELQMVKE